MRCTPLRLPAVSRAEAAASCARHAPRAVVTVLEGPLRLVLTGPAAGAAMPEGVRVSLSWGADQLVLRCPGGLPVQILGALDPGLAIADLPPDLAGLLLEAALLPALASWEQAGGRPIAIERMDPDPAPPGAAGLSLVLEDGDARWPIHLSAAAGQDAGHDAAHAPTNAILELWPVAPRPMDRFALPAVLRLGTTSLAAAALASLRPGDAVLIQTASGQDRMKDRTLVVAEAWAAPVRQEPEGWRLGAVPRRLQRLEATEPMMRVDAAGAPETLPLARLDETPVLLSFDIGRLDIPLGDLRRLGPGSVLTPDRATAEVVRITAHGQLLGFGDLVEVEGAVAVRIVRLFDHG